MTTDEKIPEWRTAADKRDVSADAFKKKIHNIGDEIPIDDTALAERVAAGVKTMRDEVKACEAERMIFQKPYDDRLKEVRDAFSAVTLKFKAHQAYLSGLLDNWNQRRKKRDDAAAEVLRKQAEEQASKAKTVEEIDAAAATAANAATVAENAGKMTTTEGLSVHTRKDWSIVIEDKMKLIKAIANGEASPDFLSVEVKEIRAAVKGSMELRELPGVKIEQTSTTQVR